MTDWTFWACRLWARWCRAAGGSNASRIWSVQMLKFWTWLYLTAIEENYCTLCRRKKWVNRIYIKGAYKISCGCVGESTEETEQFTEEGEGHGYEHCERCTSWISISGLLVRRRLVRRQTFRVFSSDWGITNIDSPGNQTEPQVRSEPKLLHQHRLYHVEYRHCIDLHHQPLSSQYF